MEDKALFRTLVPTPKYSDQNALSLALLCELAYEKSRPKMRSAARDLGFERVDIVDIRKGIDIHTQALVMSDRKNIVVVFRGTDGARDWLTDFEFSKDPGPLKNTCVHEGFQDALFPCVISLTNHIDTAGINDKLIWVTGHSLGGALASIYAGMLSENNYEVYGLYTYASPRPGDESFAQQLNTAVAGPHYRVVNTADVVPHVPPEPFFSHPGNRIILTGNGKTKSESSWLAERKKAVEKFVGMVGQSFDVADNHRLRGDGESYIPRLKARLKTRVAPQEVAEH